jgi:hypothetical protein
LAFRNPYATRRNEVPETAGAARVHMENVDDDLENAIREMGGTPPNPSDDES